MWLFTDIDKCGEGIVVVSDTRSEHGSGSGSENREDEGATQ